MKRPDIRASLRPLACVASFAAVIVFAGAESFGGTTWLKGSAFGGYGSGNTTIAQQSVAGVALADDDTTGLQQVQNYHISAGSSGDSFLSGNAIAAIGGHLVASDYPTDPLIYSFSSGGGVQYLDSILVTSASAPAGTMVTVQFSLHVAYSAGAEHSLAGEMSTNNYSLAKGIVSALASGWHGSHYVDPSSNNVVINTYDLTHTTVGLFTGAQHLDFLLDAEVGEELSLSVTVDADTAGKVSAYAPGPYDPLENAAGQAYSTVAVAFGASVISFPAAAAWEPAEIELISQRLGATFPSSASANASAAEAAMPANPYMPEPLPWAGDAQPDGKVDGGDYTIWADNYGTTDAPAWSDGGWTVGNFTEDANVDGGDYTVWADNYGYGTGGAAIPEPATMLVLAVGGAAALIRRRRK